MPLFHYEALDRTGNPVVGAMQVSDEAALSDRLRAMGYRPVTIHPPTIARRGTRQASMQTHGAGTRSAAVGRSGRVSKLSADERSMARMLHQLHLAFRAGIPAFQALSTVQAQVSHPALRQALGEMAGGVRDGHTISGEMENYPRLFQQGDIGMLRAAEIGGFLPEAFANLAARYEQDDNARRRLRIWTWFFHSNVITFLMLVALAPFFKTAIEAGFDVQAGLRAVAKTFLFVSVPLIALYFGALGWFYHVRHQPHWAYRWHRMALRLPVLGKINELRANAVFTRALQQLYQAGLGAQTAWETAAAAVPNLYLAERYGTGTRTVHDTGRLSLGLQQVGLLDPADVGMVATGESAGEVAQALQYLANRYEEDTRVALGASVIRGAITFTVWAFLLGGLGIAVLAQGYYGTVFQAVEKGMGVGE